MISLRLSLAILLALAGAARADDAPNPSFYLVNHTGQAIKEVYASPVSATGWGQDRLGDAPVNPGANAPIRLLADGNCLFDLRFVYADGHAEERRGVNTCEVDDVTAGAPVPAGNPARDPSFRIINRGRRTVTEVQTRPSGSSTWGLDRLGSTTIDVESYKVIPLPAGQCIWDVRIVFEEGPDLERRGINLCDITDFPVQ